MTDSSDSFSFSPVNNLALLPLSFLVLNNLTYLNVKPVKICDLYLSTVSYKKRMKSF